MLYNCMVTLIRIQIRQGIKPALAVILLFFFSASAIAQEGLTPEQIAKIKTVSSAVISSDGHHIAYTVSVPADPEKENRPARSHLYVLDVESGETRPYYSTSSVGNIAFRPNHESITFLTRREDDDSRSLYEIPLDGGEAVKRYSHPTNIAGYEWADNGNRIAFMAPEPLPESSSVLPYSPDIFEENIPQRRTYIADVRNENSSARELQVDGSIYLLSWSPDGGRIAVSAAPTPHIDDYYMFQQVFILDTHSLEVTAEVNNEGKIGQIEWSPDSKRLALRAGRDRNDPIDGRILIVSAGGGTPQIIDSGFEGKYEQIAWLENNRIHFIASEGVWSSYGTLRPDGTEKRKMIGTGGPILTSFDPAGNQQVVFTAQTPEHPTEVYLKKQDESEPVRLSHTNPWLEEVEMGKHEVVRYTTRDGEFEIEGMLIYPLNYREGTSIPVITQVHGGPEAHYSNGWLTSYSAPGQMGAAAGYGVFYPNYRGSTGRGIEFLYSSQADLAGKEFDDIVDGIDYLIDAGIADENRIGVTGGSYGGYASGWMSTYYSNRFAASVMFVGISNNLSKWGTSDIPEELYLVHAQKRIWDDWDWFLERSPVYWVNRAQTPLLILHGAEDTRVHPGQSMELYRHLKVRKPELPLRLVYYPGEGHGNASATARYDYNLRMLRWFDTYLMSGDSGMEVPHWNVRMQK
ncbi:MAG: S9 family peptidase [Balneolaceae bacterium]